MPAAMAALFLCQLLGELAARMARLPVPGPVVGMVLLLLWLTWGRFTPKALPETSRGILSHLSLLFVPAGAGIILHVERLSAQWLAISVAVVGSTLLALVATAVTFRLVAKAMDLDQVAREGLGREETGRSGSAHP
ncbi:MAG: CidA/LrgA family protein [Rhodospirillum sp.]|nr:CidA/LrgA family protein [Rhodospirillum sp.]MCF8492157.1 CidA/LrgA family protein [Rhodospirillum sp.]MCF8499626.1 CidA/LrgA family protein [Rhodospirillum sp.]